MSASFDIVRTGNLYKLRNYGEETIFEVMEIYANGDCQVKTTDTLEIQLLSDFIKYGKGSDFLFEEA